MEPTDASDGDLPVHLSAKLHDAPRAGYFAPYTVAPDVDTIAVPNFDLDLRNFSKTPGMRMALGWYRGDALTRRAPV